MKACLFVKQVYLLDLQKNKILFKRKKAAKKKKRYALASPFTKPFFFFQKTTA